jgi:hypothetical protein
LRKFLLKVSVGVIFSAIIIFCNPLGADAAVYTKTLTENTKITPPGVIVTWWNEIPRFKKGSVVILNQSGEVLEGILAENASLPYETGKTQSSFTRTSNPPPPLPIFINTTTEAKPMYRVLTFKGGTKVTFNERGEVIRGTLAAGDSISLNTSNHIFVSEGEISFHPNGMPATFCLSHNTYMRPVGWQRTLIENYNAPGFIEFKDKKNIELNDRGEVIKGTLNKDSKLLTEDELLSEGVIKMYEAGTTVEFNTNGFVVKAVKEQTN